MDPPHPSIRENITMNQIFDQIKVLYDNELYSNVITLASFALSIADYNPELSPGKFQTYVCYGNSLYHLGQYRRAEVMYSKALKFRKCYFKYLGSNKTSNLKEFMPDIDIKYQVHLCHMKLKQNQEAISVLETIPGKQRTCKVNLALGKLYQQGGMERPAISAYKEVLREVPLTIEAMEGLVKLGVSGAEVQSLVLECAARKGIGNIDWLMTWVKAHGQMQTREYKNAVVTLKTMDKQSPVKNNHNVLVALGTAYYYLGEMKNAVSVLQRARGQEPQLESGLDILASVLSREKRVDELDKLVPSYVPPCEYGAESWIAMGYCLYANKKLSKAAYLAQKACMMHPCNVEALLLKATIFMDMKKYDDCIVHLREAIHLAPFRYETHHCLVKCYMMLNRVKDALTLASAMCKQIGRSARTLTLYASVLMKDRAPLSRVKELLQEALQLDESFLPGVYMLVTILEQEPDLEPAIKLLQRQLTIQVNVKLHQILGELYRRNNQPEKALEQFGFALHIEPTNRRLQTVIHQLDQTGIKLENSYYMSVNDEECNNTYELGESENENEGEESEMDAVWSDLDIGLSSL